MKKDAKLEDELTCRFKVDMSTLTNFDPSTQKKNSNFILESKMAELNQNKSSKRLGAV